MISAPAADMSHQMCVEPLVLNISRGTEACACCLGCISIPPTEKVGCTHQQVQRSALRFKPQTQQNQPNSTQPQSQADGASHKGGAIHVAQGGDGVPMPLRHQQLERQLGGATQGDLIDHGFDVRIGILWALVGAGALNLISLCSPPKPPLLPACSPHKPLFPPLSNPPLRPSPPLPISPLLPSPSPLCISSSSLTAGWCHRVTLTLP